jgi:D-sedoheptulose 7-phosphate isomerase
VNVIKESRKALKNLDWSQVDKTVDDLRFARRVFCVGNGGGYAHAMHFASDLRKIAGIQAFSFDNAAEMTARINDDGWDRAWFDWLGAHGWNAFADSLFVFSVGGALDGLSPNIVGAPHGIVGANGGWMHRIVIPSTSTPVIEGCQSVVAHHIVECLAAQ